ncbi:MAG TPA: Crp/Fnr family transcriptional regulator [Noviherbaspirillum sp.]|uniref:Crp/Fnr family transcriptional regulator n=1 Tax=Noviherbaspirillum sp. TaxID=1926288 RepID=UPI002B4A6ABD|nr:Crp/Fnr family transcriptional regulator [Noviherbaspirillum sp.]HJV88599.1 Crp/Fnr family transcriptional regulator [Noviherbaspirillum sp.]
MHDHINAFRRRGNFLLDSLDDEEYWQVDPHLQVVRLAAKDVIGERDASHTHVYFPCTSVLSVLVLLSDGSAVEVGTVGKEGMGGIEALAGGDRWTETVICQIEGHSFCMPRSAFADAINGDTGLRRITQRYLLAYLGMVSQSVACNRLHAIEARFARWVLMTHDRVGGSEFGLTQEFLADMLGVKRPSISLVAGAFQQAGLIRYSRGHMMILDRPGLEKASCECYDVVRRQLDQSYEFDDARMH